MGKIYRNFSTAGKRRFNEVVSLRAKKAVNDATFAGYSKLLDDAGAEAIKNGLTPEILEAFLTSNA